MLLHADPRRARLAALLAAIPSASDPHEARSADWLRRLVACVRPRRAEDVDAASAAVREFAARLEVDPAAAAALRAYVGALLVARVHRLLYADAGTTGHRGFVGEMTARLFGRVLPPPVDTDFLSDVFVEVFDRPDDYVWLAALPDADWGALLGALGLDDPSLGPVRDRCREEAGAALRLLSHRIAALGSDPTLVRYLPALARHESPFLAQVAAIEALVARGAAAAASPADDRHAAVLLAQCRDYLDAVRRRSREAGVGVGLVYLASRLERALERTERLLALYAPDPAQDRAAAVAERRAFFVELVRQQNRRHSVGDLWRETAELVARRVTERASRSGEHYVTTTRAGLAAMFRAAAGAGLIVAVMALVKIFVAGWGLPPLWLAVAYSLNYGLGFVAIHALHLTIATKQPAMTAATLASALDGTANRQARIEALADLAAKVSRTQWVSIAGNVLVGFVVALAIGLTTSRLLGWGLVAPAKAEHLLAELHPVASLALPHAAIAGVFLFLSGLVSGYCDNLALYRRVPERLRRVRWLRRLLGAERLDRLAAYVERNLGALMGNFLFGCMLGCTPVIGYVVGLPLDIRHVAFASANLAYGLNGVQFAVAPALVLTLAAGVLAIGLVNLVVSFALALKVALRSRGIGPEQTQGLLPAILRRFVARPADFFWAPRVPRDAAVAGADADARPAATSGRGVSPPSPRA